MNNSFAEAEDQASVGRARCLSNELEENTKSAYEKSIEIENSTFEIIHEA